MPRSVIAVVAGYLIFGLSAAVLFQWSGQSPHAPASTRFIIWSTLYGVIFGALGGFTAATLAPRRSGPHAAAVALLVATGAVASMLAQRGPASWSQSTALVLMAPAAVGGGLGRVRRSRRDK